MPRKKKSEAQKLYDLDRKGTELDQELVDRLNTAKGRLYTLNRAAQQGKPGVHITDKVGHTGRVLKRLTREDRLPGFIGPARRRYALQADKPPAKKKKRSQPRLGALASR